jgi:predicted nucleotidyltransferase component of viral defense system
MIDKREISRLAVEKNVNPSTIDKDWVLGHFVDAIYSMPECRENLLFKGGTCLRKCRFQDYRFSEDLDFTSRTDSFVLDMPLLQRIASLAENRTGIPLYIQSIEELRFNDRRTGYAARIKYWGADHRKDQQPPEPMRWLTGVKIEVILYETIVFDAELRDIYHPYSDRLTENARSIPVYNIHEMLAEKIRALIQRSYTAPRDYYDIWYLEKHVENIDWQEVVNAFKIKTAYKGLSFTGVAQLINEDNDRVLKAAWKNSLGHQIYDGKLTDYNTVKKDLTVLFERIFRII